ncbi:GD13371 [Drosophila simulans]|uniref:GD13371 n=1 Tax=Drosophila simulans TaxID=7240 RepID=B4QNM5_DROSI|nr:GD13371 [Drosophila simulans]
MSAPSRLAWLWLPQWHSTTSRDSSNIYGSSNSSKSSSSNMKHQGDSYVRWRYKSLQTARKKQRSRPTARGISSGSSSTTTKSCNSQQQAAGRQFVVQLSALEAPATAATPGTATATQQQHLLHREKMWIRTNGCKIVQI